MSPNFPGLGPLDGGKVAVVVGGGPSGASCAIRMQQLAKQLHRDIRIVLFEPKQFEGERHFNQCVGVLSPPIMEILEDGLKISFPWHLVQREIYNYVLHSDRETILLEGEGQPSFAVHRVKFDAYLLKQAERQGIRVVQGRVTDLEFAPHGIMVYSDNENLRADVVVGAFGLDGGGCELFQRATSYQPPQALASIVTRIYPPVDFMKRFDSSIHAFLPGLRRIEFGAITPKKDHLTINIAGAQVTAEDMDAFLRLPAVRSVLPANFLPASLELQYFKGRFPIRPAKHLYGDRYVTLGDASGLLRPFKGKGINSGCLTGIRAAETILKLGISRKAFRSYYRLCDDVTQDMWYGRLIRQLAVSSANIGWLDVVIELARGHPHVRTGLFHCVSGHKSFKAIRQDISLRQTLPSLLFTGGRWLLKLTTQTHH